MRRLPVILTLSFIISIWLGVVSYINEMSPTWRQIELVESQLRIREYDKRMKEVTLVLPVFLYGSFFMVIGSFCLLVFWITHKRIENSNRQINGSFPLKWITFGRVKVLIDPNKLSQSFGALTPENVLNSKQAFAHEETQFRLVSNVDRNRLMQSLPEDGFKYAATGKFLAGAYDKQIKVVDNDMPLLEDAKSVATISLQEAISQSNLESWVIGQNESSYCTVSIFDLVHIGLIGATKTGKTSSTALLAMYYALKHGFHVIALDGKGGIDWGAYNAYAEVHTTTYETFSEQITQISVLHELRLKDLKRYGASTIDDVTEVNIPHILVILEEFGFICQSLKSANKRVYDDTISKLSNLMRVSRATGIHFLLIDQLSNSWPNTIIANIKGWVVYRIKGKLANNIGEYHLDNLAPVGEFSFEGTAYKAWFTKQHIDKLLQPFPKRKWSLLKSVTSNSEGGVFKALPHTQSVTSNKVVTASNTPVTTSNEGDNRLKTSDNNLKNSNKVVTDNNTPTEVFTSLVLKGAAVHQSEKDEVYRVYTATGRKKNLTCKLIWGDAGGYLKYLNQVIAEKEQEE